ncbi:MAG TPA: phosphoribosylamine--glycine ligase [Candidatus Ruthenibacterium merdavium]|uniref:Phosphoribosylamine--glycine ligase n=1 Tax=Candidatus Ruthenibacterium merdavium TaxID=2838752 RepID=A0A9D2Q1X8_9FIRM|nr:phosphoribosylamine--glycine ligase [Candidatus Ruthenibacterium merdavium]
MKVLVVGGGGREHAIVRKLKESRGVTKLYCAPGNGGIAMDAECVNIAATDIDAMVRFAEQEKIDYVVVAPDDPLAMGMVDALSAAGIPAFGPNKAAARIEASKAFSKDLMKRYHIPTAAYEVFDDADKAKAYVKEKNRYPVVIKADGLALGKGVLICETEEAAMNAINSMMCEGAFGASGSRVVIEEFLTGPEVSVLSFTDGKTVVPMISSMDHKRALDGDKGLNTGGMGTIAPNPYYTPEVAKVCMETIFRPTVEAMAAEGCPFKGCLYFGLMLTPDGPKVIEYNCRFGDPETQVVLPLLESDLLAVMQAVTNGTLADCEVKFSDKSAACVILASGGYPEAYEKGKAIAGLASGQPENGGAVVYHAGTKQEPDGALVTAGGRVLGVTALAPSLKEAIDAAYIAAENITFEGAHMRRDIGARALAAKEGKEG